MMTTVTVSRAEVMDAVGRTTAYIASRREDPDAETYRRIALTPGDHAMVERLWQEAVSELCHTLWHSLRGLDDAGGMLRFRFDAPPAAAALRPRLAADITACLTHGVAARWLAVTDAQSAPPCAARAAAIAQTLAQLLRQPAPSTRPVPPL